MDSKPPFLRLVVLAILLAGWRISDSALSAYPAGWSDPGVPGTVRFAAVAVNDIGTIGFCDLTSCNKNLFISAVIIASVLHRQ